MKRFQGFIIGVIVAVTLPALAYRVTDTNVTFGTNGDVVLNIGGGQLKWNNTLGTLEKSNDGGVTTEEIGTAGKVKFDKTQTVELSGSNGFGSTNTLIRKFTSIEKVSGDGVYSINHNGGDAVNGLEITMIKDAQVRGTYCEQSDGSSFAPYAMTVNANVSTDVNSLNYSTGLRGKSNMDIGEDYDCVGFNFKVNAGQIIRPHTGAGATDFVGISVSPSLYFEATSTETLDASSITIGHMKGSIGWGPFAGCIFVASNTGSFADFPTDAECASSARTVLGDAIDSSGGTKVELSFAKLKKGNYTVKLSGDIRKHNTQDQFDYLRFVSDKGHISSISTIHSNSTELGVGDYEFTFDVNADESNVKLNLQHQGGASNDFKIFSDVVGFRVSVYYNPTVDNSEILLPKLGLPIGGIMMYPLGTCPSGYLSLNGNAISRTTYAGLFSVLSTIYGVGNGSTTFNVPDMRGRFPRMTDLGSARDPDRVSRTNCQTGGPTGDNTGSCQGSQNASHSHVVDVWFGENGTGPNQPNIQGYGGTGPYASGTTVASGGNEARPINMNMNFCIKY